MKSDENWNLAVGGSRQRILNSNSYTPAKIFCFSRDESIVGYQPAIFIRKNLGLMEKINEIIQNAFENGLFVKWDRLSQKKKELILPFEPKLALGLRETAPTFLLAMFGGTILSILGLCGEIFVHRKMNQNQRASIWKYFEQFFDGKRHYFKNMTGK